MRAAVVYESYYGNTHCVAEALAGALRAAGHEVGLVDLRSGSPQGPYDLIVLGGPTRFGRMTRRLRRFADQCSREYGAAWFAVFDTFGPLSGDEERDKANDWLTHGAGPRLREHCEDRGMQVVLEVLRCPVTALKGPLEEGCIDACLEWTARVLTEMGSPVRGLSDRAVVEDEGRSLPRTPQWVSPDAL